MLKNRMRLTLNTRFDLWELLVRKSDKPPVDGSWLAEQLIQAMAELLRLHGETRLEITFTSCLNPDLNNWAIGWRKDGGPWQWVTAGLTVTNVKRAIPAAVRRYVTQLAGQHLVRSTTH